MAPGVSGSVTMVRRPDAVLFRRIRHSVSEPSTEMWSPENSCFTSRAAQELCSHLHLAVGPGSWGTWYGLFVNGSCVDIALALKLLGMTVTELVMCGRHRREPRTQQKSD